MDKRQREQFKVAVENKKLDSRERSERPPAQAPDGGSAVSGDEKSLSEAARPQDVADARAKNTAHRKMTADKWNQ